MSELAPPVTPPEAAIETPPPAEPPAASWRDGLPDDLKSDATLARYTDVEALGRAHIEAHKVAKSKISLPGADADEAAWGEFYDKIGRPKTADDYDLPMPELAFGEDATDEAKAEAIAMQKEMFKPYRELAHQLGLRPEQAAGVMKYDLDRQKAHFEKGAAEIDALKKEMGAGYGPALDSARAIFKRLGFGDEFAEELDQKVGSANLIRGFMKLAGVAGEPAAPIEGEGVGLSDGRDPEATLKAKQADPEWRKKYNSGDPATTAEYQRLLGAAQKAALGNN